MLIKAIDLLYNKLFKKANIQSDMANRMMYIIISSLDPNSSDDPIIIDNAVHGVKNILKFGTKICLKEATHILNYLDLDNNLLDKLSENTPIFYNLIKSFLKYKDYFLRKRHINNNINIPNDLDSYISILQELVYIFSLPEWIYIPDYGGEKWLEGVKHLLRIANLYKDYLNADEEDKIKLGKLIISNMSNFDNLMHNTGAILDKLIVDEASENLNKIAPREWETKEELNNMEELLNSQQIRNPYSMFTIVEKYLPISLPFKKYISQIRANPEYHKAKREQQEKELENVKYTKLIIQEIEGVISILLDGLKSLYKITPNSYNENHKLASILVSNMDYIFDYINNPSELTDHLDRLKDKIPSKKQYFDKAIENIKSIPQSIKLSNRDPQNIIPIIYENSSKLESFTKDVINTLSTLVQEIQ